VSIAILPALCVLYLVAAFVTVWKSKSVETSFAFCWAQGLLVEVCIHPYDRTVTDNNSGIALLAGKTADLFTHDVRPSTCPRHHSAGLRMRSR
jgi:hypothetical protein